MMRHLEIAFFFFWQFSSLKYFFSLKQPTLSRFYFVIMEKNCCTSRLGGALFLEPLGHFNTARLKWDFPGSFNGEGVYRDGQIILKSGMLPCSLDQLRKPGNQPQMTKLWSRDSWIFISAFQLRASGKNQICSYNSISVALLPAAPRQQPAFCSYNKLWILLDPCLFSSGTWGSFSTYT